MSTYYNLLDEPWLPVRLENGQIKELGLLELFRRSTEVVALAETAPPSLVAEYRLLLAITHRALVRSQGRWKDSDRMRWYQDGLPTDEIEAYLEHWRERFWLFHPAYPFMQVAALASAEETRNKRKPWTQISLASANGNAPVVFDHALDEVPAAIDLAPAVGHLLGFLQFTPGGLVKTLRDADKAGALVNTAAVIPVGTTLAQTLCLCVHPAPLAGTPEPDLPAWERPPLTLAELSGAPVLASGPNDRYTRQSRAVLLEREEAAGQVRWVRFAAGLALGDDPHAPDQMACFRVGSTGLVRVSFSDGRALWRDLPALLPSPQAANSGQSAAVVQRAASLHRLLGTCTVEQAVLIAGLASDQAKMLRWRSERIVLPTGLLVDEDRAQELREHVGKAEELHGQLKKLAVNLVAAGLPDSGSKDTRSRARGMLEAGQFSPRYFAAAQRSLPALMQFIANGRPEQALSLWHRALRISAIQSWQTLLIGIGQSARALQADARYWPRLHALLNQQFPKTQAHVSEDA